MTGTSITSRRAAAAAMGTVVAIEVLTREPKDVVGAALSRALGWFEVVERACSRFDDASELRLLLPRVDVPVRVSAVLFEAVQFACELACQTDGAFDPTIGQRMEAAGFDRHYRSGKAVESFVPWSEWTSYRDVDLDPSDRSITLRRPMVMDLGAVAKGLAIDLAARELAGFDDYCVDAGGDVFVAGHGPSGRAWRVGVRSPYLENTLVGVLEASGQAVCTSGGYERRTLDGSGHHLLDPRMGKPARGLASVTVVAPTALAADGFATAAFVLGFEAGTQFLNAQGVRGLLIAETGETSLTQNLGEMLV